MLGTSHNGAALIKHERGGDVRRGEAGVVSDRVRKMTPPPPPVVAT